MVCKKARGKRSKTRSKLKRKPRTATVNDILRPFKEGARVQIDIRSEMHSGMPPAVYQGSFGTVKGKQGSSYRVDVMKGNLEKTLIVHGIHLRSEGVEKKSEGVERKSEGVEKK